MPSAWHIPSVSNAFAATSVVAFAVVFGTSAETAVGIVAGIADMVGMTAATGVANSMPASVVSYNMVAGPSAAGTSAVAE